MASTQLHQDQEPSKLALGLYFNSPKFSDVILKVGPHTFHAHRLVMCSWSDIFKKILATPSCPSGARNLSEDLAKGHLEHEENSTFRFDEEPDCCDVFHLLLKFMYTETVTISNENAVPLLKLSIKCDIEELKLLCEKYICQTQRDLETWIGILPLAVSSQLEHAKMSCLSFLCENFEQISSQQLQSLDGACLAALLGCKCPSIAVEDEFIVFQKLTPWLMHCTQEDEFIRVVECIRFPFMSALQLMNIGTTDIMKRVLKNNPHFLISAYEQHALFREASISEFPISTPQPRLYLRPPFDMFETSCKSDATGGVQLDQEGFCEIQINRTIPIRNVLQEIKSNNGNERHEYERGSSGPYVEIRDTPIFDHSYYSVREREWKYEREIKIGLFERHGSQHKGQTGQPPIDETEQVVEVAVQIIEKGGTTKRFVSRKRLPPSIRLQSHPQDKSFSYSGLGYGQRKIALFHFKMNLGNEDIYVGRAVKARIALVIHSGGVDNAQIDTLQI